MLVLLCWCWCWCCCCCQHPAHAAYGRDYYCRASTDGPHVADSGTACCCVSSSMRSGCRHTRCHHRVAAPTHAASAATLPTTPHGVDELPPVAVLGISRPGYRQVLPRPRPAVDGGYCSHHYRRVCAPCKGDERGFGGQPAIVCICKHAPGANWWRVRGGDAQTTASTPKNAGKRCAGAKCAHFFFARGV